MELNLSPIEVRILGSLLEKETTTPEYYPLTLNSLVNACNQKSSRDPVMDLSEEDVSKALDSLREKRLVWQLSATGSRVYKYEHNLKSHIAFTEKEIAVICILLLRGPQTIGEIRTRSERLYNFNSLVEVEETLKGLMSRDGYTLVKELPRLPGHKENRYCHLFSGEPDIELVTTDTQAVVKQTSSSTTNSLQARVDSLEEQVRKLSDDLINLQNEFKEFKEQFG